LKLSIEFEVEPTTVPFLIVTDGAAALFSTMGLARTSERKGRSLEMNMIAHDGGKQHERLYRD